MPPGRLTGAEDETAVGAAIGGAGTSTPATASFGGTGGNRALGTTVVGIGSDATAVLSPIGAVLSDVTAETGTSTPAMATFLSAPKGEGANDVGSALETAAILAPTRGALGGSGTAGMPAATRLLDGVDAVDDEVLVTVVSFEGTPSALIRP
jgi:hypothetical protein